MTKDASMALFPASFDPVTNGHLDITYRALRLFGRLVLAGGAVVVVGHGKRHALPAVAGLVVLDARRTSSLA